MKAGALDQRITFQTYTFTPDGGGGQTRALGNVASTPTVWAGVKAVRGSEVYREDRTAAIGSYLFTVRYRDDINEGDVVIWRSETYNIRNVKRSSGRKLYSVIEAERGVAT